MSAIQSKELEIPTLSFDSGQLSSILKHFATDPASINNQLVDTLAPVSSIKVDSENIGQLNAVTINLAPTLDIQDMINGFGQASPQSAILKPTVVSRKMDRPWVEILEQPKANSLRFRYQCEGRGAGALQGATSTLDHKTFPKIQVHGFKGPAVVVVSCVTHDTTPPKAHPHNLVSPATVGRDGCKKGVCTVNINPDTMTAEFQHLGVQCVRRKDIAEALQQRKDIRVDPFRQGFDHANSPQTIDLNAVRLCFQVFYEKDVPGKYTGVMDPVCSEPIYDAKAKRELQIMDISDTTSPAVGGKKIILLCERVSRDDIRIKFYDDLGWEAHAEFNPSDVHKQYAIVFKTPPYKDIHLMEEARVWVKLEKSNREESEPQEFSYLPANSFSKQFGGGHVRGRSSLDSTKTEVKEETELGLPQASPTGGRRLKAEPYSQVRLQGSSLVLGNVIQHTTTPGCSVGLSTDVINIPTYSFAHSPASSTTTFPAQRVAYTPNIGQPAAYFPVDSNSATFGLVASSNNSDTSYVSPNSNYSPVYSYAESVGEATTYGGSSSGHTYLSATPLSPESHQGFTNMNISSNAFDDVGNDLDHVDLGDLIMNQTPSSSASHHHHHDEDVESLSGKILSGSMDLQPTATAEWTSPGNTKRGKRSQKEADLLSGSAVVPRQLGRQQSSINTPNVSAQINTPDVSQNLSEGYIERTVNNLDL